MIAVINSVSFFKSLPSCTAYSLFLCCSLLIHPPLKVQRVKGLFLWFTDSWFISSLMCCVGGGKAWRKHEWWGEPRLLFDLTTIVLLVGSDLVSRWLGSIQWPVITIPEEFPLYVLLSSSLEPATAGNLLKTTDWSDSFWLQTSHADRKETEQAVFFFSFIMHMFWRLGVSQLHVFKSWVCIKRAKWREGKRVSYCIDTSMVINALGWR